MIDLADFRLFWERDNPDLMEDRLVQILAGQGRRERLRMLRMWRLGGSITREQHDVLRALAVPEGDG